MDNNNHPNASDDMDLRSDKSRKRARDEDECKRARDEDEYGGGDGDDNSESIEKKAKRRRDPIELRGDLHGLWSYQYILRMHDWNCGFWPRGFFFYKRDEDADSSTSGMRMQIGRIVRSESIHTAHQYESILSAPSHDLKSFGTKIQTYRIALRLYSAPAGEYKPSSTTASNAFKARGVVVWNGATRRDLKSTKPCSVSCSTKRTRSISPRRSLVCASPM
jgi:hypothetical protein